MSQGKVNVTWSGLGLYLGNKSHSSNEYGFDAVPVSEDPVVKAKRAAADSLSSVAKQKALVYLNDRRKESLSGKDLRDVWQRVGGDDVDARFSNDEKQSEGFLFSYKQWLRFDLTIALNAEALNHQLDQVLVKVQQREERKRVERENRERLAEQMRVRKRKEAERQVQMKRERQAHLERERREETERKRQLAEMERRKEQEEKERLDTLNVIQWGSREQPKFLVPINQLIQLHPKIGEKFLRTVMIRSNVDVADLVLNGVQFPNQNFPQNVELPLGRNMIEIHHPDYTERTVYINLDTDVAVNEVDLRLKNKQISRLELIGDHLVGATIIVDGETYSSSYDGKPIKLEWGRYYEVSVGKSGKDWSKRIEIYPPSEPERNSHQVVLKNSFPEIAQDKIWNRSYMLAGNCEVCHGMDGVSVDEKIPSIAGLAYDYIVKKLNQFSEESVLSNTIMGRLAKGYSLEEKRKISRYYSSLSNPND